MPHNVCQMLTHVIAQQPLQAANVVRIYPVLKCVVKAAYVKIFPGSQAALALMTRNAWKTRILAIRQQIQQPAPAVTMHQILLRATKADTACQLCQVTPHAPALMLPSV